MADSSPSTPVLKTTAEQRQRAWANSLTRLYGITPEDYLEMWQAQGGLCAICLSACKAGRLCVDHDHETGRVRGLLCRACNVQVGVVENYGERVREYLDGRA